MDGKAIFDQLFINKACDTRIQMLRYVLAAITAIGADFLSLYILTEFFHIHYLTSAALGFGIGLSTNYLISIIWVFSKRKLKNKWIEFVVFVLTGLLGLFLTEVIIWSLTEILGFHYMFSKSISFLVIYTVNFYIRKKILF